MIGPCSDESLGVDDDEEQLGLARDSAADASPCPLALARACRQPRQLDLELERVAGNDLPAEAGRVEPAEQRQLAGEPLVGEHRDGAELGDRLAISTPGSVGRPGK